MATNKSSNPGEVPIEYFKWRLYEVIVPLGVPGLVFLALWLLFSQDRAPSKSAADALVAIAGAGDLLIFGALLLINVASTLLFEKDAKHGYSLSQSDSHGHNTLIFGIFLLLGYGLIRILCHSSKYFEASSMHFVVGIASMVILLLAVLWSDSVVRMLYLRRISQRFNHGKIIGQYNFD